MSAVAVVLALWASAAAPVSAAPSSTGTGTGAAGAAPPGGVAQLSCKGNLCVALGNIQGETTPGSDIAVSHDGGAHWSWQRLPGAQPQATSVACATSRVCTVVGGLPIEVRAATWRTTDAGRHWHLGRRVTGVDELSSATCSGHARCEAVGEADDQFTLWHSTDGGATWARDDRVPDQGGLDQVSCSPGGTCMAEVPLVRSLDAGRSWRVVRQPGTVLSSSCPDGETCIATVESTPADLIPHDDVTTDGGATWQPLAPVDGGDVVIPSCARGGFCVGLVGPGPGWDHVATSTDGGVTWAPARWPFPANTPFESVACTTRLRCVVGAEQPSVRGCLPESFTTDDGGSTWVLHRADVGLAARRGQC